MNRILFVLLALVAGLGGLLPMNPVWAATPTPMPTPTSPNLTVVVASGGASLWNNDQALVAQLAPGAALKATQRSTDGAWLYVQNNTGANGWVALADVIAFNTESLPTQAVTLNPATPTPAATAVATSVPMSTTSSVQGRPATAEVTLQNGALNIRSGPGTSYAVIGKAQRGETFTLQGRSATGEWVQITTPSLAGGFGWVNALYVRLSSAPDQAPLSAQVNQQASPASAQRTATTPANTGSRSTGLHGKLVFQEAWGGAIYLYDLDTGALRELTHGFDPSLSPDGKQVTFTRLGGEHGLWLINTDGSNERRIFGERNAFFAPKWSPDGKAIVFMRTDSTYNCVRCVPEDLRRALPWRSIRPRLARVDLNGGNYRDLATLDTATAPDWNSAGIVYASAVGIQFTTDDSKDSNRLVHYDILQQHYRDPDWQPGGGRILFQQWRAGHWDIFAINLDGSGLTPITRPVTVLVDALPSNVSPAWSPDGQHIVFLSNRTADNAAGAWGLWVMNADGSNPQRIAVDLPFVYTDVEEQMVDWGP